MKFLRISFIFVFFIHIKMDTQNANPPNVVDPNAPGWRTYLVMALVAIITILVIGFLIIRGGKLIRTGLFYLHPVLALAAGIAAIYFLVVKKRVWMWFSLIMMVILLALFGLVFIWRRGDKSPNESYIDNRTASTNPQGEMVYDLGVPGSTIKSSLLGKPTLYIPSESGSVGVHEVPKGSRIEGNYLVLSRDTVAAPQNMPQLIPQTQQPGPQPKFEPNTYIPYTKPRPVLQQPTLQQQSSFVKPSPPQQPVTVSYSQLPFNTLRPRSDTII